MISTPTIVQPGGLVLVTGINGFIGTHVADILLGQGYAVRGTVRSKDKATWVKEAFAERHPDGRLEVAVVPELFAAGVIDRVLENVDGVIHIAGDMSFGPDPNTIITPMIANVRNLVQRAAKSPSVKRFVLTSSNRAAMNPGNKEPVTLDSNSWNEVAVKAAWAPPPYEGDRVWDVYAALKTQTEQEMWKLAKEGDLNLVVNSVLPDYVIGPIFHAKQSGSTGKIVKTLWDDPTQYDFLKNFVPQFFIDVEDTALLHIAALTQEDVKSERLMGFAGTFNFNSWLSVFRELDSSKAWPEDDPTQGHDLTRVDTSREIELLSRFGRKGWISFHDSVARNVLQSAPGT